MARKALILLLALLVGCATPPVPEDVSRPLLIVYRKPGTDDLHISVTTPAGSTTETYGTLTVAVVKFLALVFNVSEKEMWEQVSKARLVSEIYNN